MIRVGIVAEGVSDWLVLEAVMRQVHPDIEFQRLQPEYTLVSKIGYGWRGVKAWCEEYGSRLEEIMKGVVGKPLHLLVIHADCSMADKVGVERNCPPASDTGDALLEVVSQSWLRWNQSADFVVIATPSKSSDAWVVASLDPVYANLPDLECDHEAEVELTRRRLLRLKNGQVKKSATAYAPLAAKVGERLDHVCSCCSQAHGFRSRFQDAVTRVLPQLS